MRVGWGIFRYTQHTHTHTSDGMDEEEEEGEGRDCREYRERWRGKESRD